MPENNRDEIAKLEALYATNPAGRVFTHLAEAYRKAGEYDRARSILEQGLEKHPTYASAHVVLGRVLMDLNMSDEAVEAFRKVLQLDPHNLVALRSLGDLARAGGRHAEAMGYFEELRHQDPTNEEIGAIIAELLAAPDFHAAEPPEPLPELSDVEGPNQRAPAAAFSEPPGDAAPESQIEHLMAQAVEPEFAGQETRQEELPGDLADFARQNEAAAQADYGTVDLEEQPAEPAQAAAELQPPPAQLEDAPGQLEETAVQFGEPIADLEEPLEAPPAEIPIDLGPSDAVIEVPPDEAFQSIDFSEFSGETEQTFEEVTSAETSLEAVPPEPQAAESTPGVFEPAPELVEQAAVTFEPVAEVFEPPAAPFESPQEAELATPTGEVLTETMADLYRSQGLYDRSAEVYRALLLERPDDAQLRAKLQEVEQEMMPTAAATPPAPEAPPPFAPPAEPEFEVPLPFMTTAPEGVREPVISQAEDDVKSPWTGFNAAASSEPSLYAWQEEAQRESDAGPPVADYFRTLLSWRPARPMQSSFTQAQPFDLGEPIETGDKPVFQQPISGASTPPQPPSTAQGMPWDNTAMQPESPSAGAAGEGDDFDNWFAEEPPPEEPSPASQPAATMPQSIADETIEGDEEDDDLEMFRSWLQSLKK